MNSPIRLLLIAPSYAASSPAMQEALALTQSLGATLHVVSYVHSEPVDIVGMVDVSGGDKAQENLKNARRLWLQSVLSGLRDKGLDVSYEVLWACPSAQAMTDYIDRRLVDLVIKDIHEDSALQRVMLSSLDWDLLRSSSVSILFVKHASVDRPLKFMAAIELGAMSHAEAAQRDRIVSAARSLAVRCRAALHLVSVYDRNDLGGHLLNEVLNIEHIPSFESRKCIFDQYAESQAIAPGHRHFIVGNTAHAISEYIGRCGYDLLVIASHDNGSSSANIGHTATALLAQAPCNMMVLKPESVCAQIMETTLIDTVEVSSLDAGAREAHLS